MNYVVYDLQGEIVVYGNVPDGNVPDDQGLGTLIQNVDGNTWTHYVASGVLIAYTPEQVAAKAVIPDFPAVWSNAAMAWEDQRSVDVARQQVLDALDSAYATAIAAGVTFTTVAGDTRAYQSDPDSVNRLQNCILGWIAVQSVPPGFYWVATDNTQVPFTWADLVGLGAAFLNPGHAAFETLQDLKAAARGATTLESVKAVSWPAS